MNNRPSSGLDCWDGKLSLYWNQVSHVHTNGAHLNFFFYWISVFMKESTYVPSCFWSPLFAAGVFTLDPLNKLWFSSMLQNYKQFKSYNPILTHAHKFTHIMCACTDIWPFNLLFASCTLYWGLYRFYANWRRRIVVSYPYVMLCSCFQPLCVSKYAHKHEYIQLWRPLWWYANIFVNILL